MDGKATGGKLACFHRKAGQRNRKAVGWLTVCPVAPGENVRWADSNSAEGSQIWVGKEGGCQLILPCRRKGAGSLSRQGAANPLPTESPPARASRVVPTPGPPPKRRILTDGVHHAGLPGISLHGNDVLETVHGDDPLPTGPDLQDALHFGAGLQGREGPREQRGPVAEAQSQPHPPRFQADSGLPLGKMHQTALNRPPPLPQIAAFHPPNPEP